MDIGGGVVDIGVDKCLESVQCVVYGSLLAGETFFYLYGNLPSITQTTDQFA